MDIGRILENKEFKMIKQIPLVGILLFSGCGLATHEEIVEQFEAEQEAERLAEERKIELTKIRNSLKNRTFASNGHSKIYDELLNVNWVGDNSFTAVSFYKAKFECEKYGYRLPTIQELLRIVDYDKTSAPFVFDEFLPYILDKTYWTSTTYHYNEQSSDNEKQFVVSFNSGIILGNEQDSNSSGKICIEDFNTLK